MNPEDFRALVYEKASACHRDLPWRRTRDPYAIMVSEYMLQQTQVVRVVPKYSAWLERFPDFQALAESATQEVLRYWSGLGYNRRALALQTSARTVARQYGSRLPEDEKSLRGLPGVGKYTARAILAFAFDRPTVFLETNIRAVLLKHFFPEERQVAEATLEEKAALVVDTEAPRKWYNALMDYGAELKRVEENHSVRSSNYRKQMAFAGSFRSLRGAVLKRLLEQGRVSKEELYAELSFSGAEIERCCELLVKEGFAAYEGGALEIRD
ncbi:MAG TPA: A/G-specific adenine glycosylase [Spirochaetales bacterium]|nr:A/G-specific adenine glycosylase [Spirochaetales bacterium]